jgi:hypothetical protein
VQDQGVGYDPHLTKSRFVVVIGALGQRVTIHAGFPLRADRAKRAEVVEGGREGGGGGWLQLTDSELPCEKFCESATGRGKSNKRQADEEKRSVRMGCRRRKAWEVRKESERESWCKFPTVVTTVNRSPKKKKKVIRKKKKKGITV